MKLTKQVLEEVWYTIEPLVEILFKKRSIVQEFNGHKPTIVAIHGIFGSWPNSGIKNYLANRHQHTYLLDWGAQTGPFNLYLDKLKKFIKENKIERPILLGTSVGGILALSYALDEGMEKVKGIITIEAPYKGVSIPKIANIYPGVKETRPGTAIIRRVNSIVYPKGLIHASCGQYDEFVRAKGEPPNGVTSIILPYWGHAVNQHVSPELEKWLDKILDHELI